MYERVGVYLIGLSYAAQGDPQGAHHGVPNQPFIPHLYCQAQIQAVYLTAQAMEGGRAAGREREGERDGEGD